MSISWKRAGAIVILAHVGALGGVMGYNKYKSSVYRTEREDRNQQYLANAGEVKSVWPGDKEAPKIVARPKELSKKIINTVSDKTLQEKVAEKAANLLTFRESSRKYLEGVYNELEDTYNTTVKEVTKAKEETIKATEKKLAIKEPTTKKPLISKEVTTKVTTKPAQTPKPKTKPKTDNIVYQRKTTTRGNSIMTEEEKKEVIRQTLSSKPDMITQYPPSPDYHNLRYTYERVMVDPHTGRTTRQIVRGPVPIRVQ